MLYQYILEFKSRILLIVVSWFDTLLICYCYKETLLFLLIKLNIKLYYLESFYFISTNLTDVFSVYLQLSYFVSNQVSLCFLIYHFLIYIAPGLFKYEYKTIKLTIILCCFFCLLSFLILNIYLLPHLWSFFLSFQNNSSSKSLNIFFEAQIIQYLNFYIYLHYRIIIISQIFAGFFLILNYIENKISFIIQTRKFTYTIFLILATCMTPPDIFSQIFLWFCFILIYEFFIICNLFKTIMFKKNS